MSGRGVEGSVRIEGRLYVRLEVVAELYELRVEWLDEAYRRGALGEGVQHEQRVCIAAAQLERVARLVRLHRLLEGNLDKILRELGRSP